MTPDRKTISIRQACELLDVSRRTIYNWIASGKVERVRRVTGSIRIFVDTLSGRRTTPRSPAQTHEAPERPLPDGFAHPSCRAAQRSESAGGTKGRL